ncbi:MAG TPA: 3-deoxy-D-manno-octulosonic acid transferase [Gemmataceae bacterium]|nr:3-deoxy-D-manno-octulosonic acid transferase [Gemmataceae bacterium]
MTSLLLNLVYFILLVLISPWLLVRSIRTGRYRSYLREKILGPSEPIAVNGRPAIWFHGVSVGEIHLLRQVVRAFRERHPDWQVVISATTDTGLAEARKHFADLPVVPYPFDFSWAVRRAIRQISPRIIVLAESELWPSFLRAANRAQVLVAVINGRMSPRTFRRYSNFPGLARRLVFDRVALFAMQSENYARNLRALGVNPARVHVTGSVKYDGVAADRDNPKTRDLAQLLDITPSDLVWVAGSTHDPEERIVLNVFAHLRSQFGNLKLILVPRAPERFDEVAQLVERAGMNCVRRSRLTDEPVSPDAVMLIDTMGELAAAWGLATIGFTGGSLNERRGGQSMIEPAGLGVPVLFGPHTWNFRDAVVGLLEVGGAIQVRDEPELEREAGRLLADASLREHMGTAARAFVQQQQGATARTLDMLESVIAAPPRLP